MQFFLNVIGGVIYRLSIKCCQISCSLIREVHFVEVCDFSDSYCLGQSCGCSGVTLLRFHGLIKRGLRIVLVACIVSLALTEIRFGSEDAHFRLLRLWFGSTKLFHILTHTLLSDRIFQAVLLVQVFSETYKVLIVGSPLELQVNATDSFELRSFGTPFANWIGIDARLIPSQYSLFSFMYLSPNMILRTHILGGLI